MDSGSCKDSEKVQWFSRTEKTRVGKASGNREGRTIDPDESFSEIREFENCQVEQGESEESWRGEVEKAGRGWDI